MEKLPENREQAARAVYQALDALGISYRSIDHAPAFCMEDVIEVNKSLNAVSCKNYFLTTRSRKLYALCVARPDVRFRSADISKQAGTPRLTFAEEDEMWEMLRTFPGAVTPMGLLFDPEHRVRLLVDEGLYHVEQLAFHPCDNSKSLAMSSKDFFECFLPAVGCQVDAVQFHDFDENML